MTSWLVLSTPEVQASQRPSLGRGHCVVLLDLLSQCLSPPRSKWVPVVELLGKPNKIVVSLTCDGLASRPREVEILLR